MKSIFSICLLFLITFSVLGNSNQKPNIIVILLDDAGYADFSFNGCKEWETPNIDKLAERGVIFTDAHVSATVCSPSRAGLMTGRYQQRFGHECNSPRNGLGMDPKEKTIADVLKTAGYKTMAVGKWHLGEGDQYHPNNRGFDEFYGFLGGHRSYFYEPEKDDKKLGGKAIQHNGQLVKFDGYLTDVFTDKTIEFIEENKEQPFFIYYSPNAVHGPMHAKKEHLEIYKDSPRPKLAAMTHSLDENVGKLVKALEDEEIIDNTLIFFLSDNGGVFRNNNCADNFPLKGEKGNKFEGGHRVPFFMTYTGKIEGGKKYEGLSSSFDIFATSLAEAGIKETTGRSLDGVNLIPFVNGKMGQNPPHKYLFWRKDWEAAVRTDKHKLIRVKDHGYALYNLSVDIGESNNLAARDSLKLDNLNQQLLNWEQELTQPLWTEGDAWQITNQEIHRALMNNEKPKYRSPGAMKKYLKSLK